MKVSVKLPLTSKSKILVDIGEEIDDQTRLFSTSKTSDEIIPLSKILKIKKKEISKYLVKKAEAEIIEGEVIAKKKSFISSIAVKSPVSGRIKEIDLKEGIVVVSQGVEETAKTLVPDKSLVKNITKDHIEIEVGGVRFEAEKGAGSDVLGMLADLSKIDDDPFGFDDEVENRIVIFAKSRAGVVAKLEALGAKAIIVNKELGETTDLAYLVVSTKVYEALHKYIGKNVWLRPQDREIIVLN